MPLHLPLQKALLKHASWLPAFSGFKLTKWGPTHNCSLSSWHMGNHVIWGRTNLLDCTADFKPGIDWSGHCSARCTSAPGAMRSTPGCTHRRNSAHLFQEQRLHQTRHCLCLSAALWSSRFEGCCWLAVQVRRLYLKVLCLGQRS